MDILYFLDDRIRFVRQFYDAAATPFQEVMRLIEAGEEPITPFFEAEEIPFEAEYIDAQESLNWLGIMCLTSLSSTFLLFLEAWNGQIGIRCRSHSGAIFKKNGWFHGYRVCFLEKVGIDWNNGPSDLRLLEELVLTRNRGQHPESITTLSIAPLRHDFEKLENTLFFVGPHDKEQLKQVKGNFQWKLSAPTITVTTEKLTRAADEIQSFCRWLDSEIQDALAKSSRRPRPNREIGL